MGAQSSYVCGAEDSSNAAPDEYPDRPESRGNTMALSVLAERLIPNPTRNTTRLNFEWSGNSLPRGMFEIRGIQNRGYRDLRILTRSTS